MSKRATQALQSAVPSGEGGHRNHLQEAQPAPRDPSEVLSADSPEPPAALGRIAWAITTVVFAVAGLVLLLDGYDGYASVTFAVAVAAGINLV